MNSSLAANEKLLNIVVLADDDGDAKGLRFVEALREHQNYEGLLSSS